MELAILGGAPVVTSSFPWPLWDDEDRAALIKVLDSGHWGCLSGSMVEKFEQTFSKYHEAKHCICTTSGTTALQTALLAWGISVGDEVIIPAYTFVATATAVLDVGAVPVFADINPDTYEIDASSVLSCITERTRAIVAVHIGGSPANLDLLTDIAKKRGLLLLEDAAQAVGAIYKGRKVGSIGDIGCFSFQATKNLNCGEGGAIVTDNDELAAKCRSIINCGRPDPHYSFRVAGTNHRMTEFQAAVLTTQLARLEEQTKLRADNYSFLEQELGSIPGIVPALVESDTVRRGCHLFMFGYDKQAYDGLSRDVFVAALNAEGVPNCCGYVPLYRNDLLSIHCSRYPQLYKGYCRGKEYSRLNLYNVERVSEISVWILQQVLLGSREEMALIVKAFMKIYENHRKLLDRCRVSNGEVNVD